jgi:hypothetical protein
MSILKNAVDSIAVGLEDYYSSDPRRIDSATRNIYAGMLLLFKHKLSLLSPKGSDEVLLKQIVIPSEGPNGQITWTGKGRKTVDVPQVQERFESLKILVDWNRVKKIQEYRNEIEHYFSQKTKDAASKVISDCFLVIRDFISEQLGQDAKEVLGQESWSKLVEVAEVHEREKDSCLATLDSVNWGSFTVKNVLQEHICSNCGSDLIYIKSPKLLRSDNEFSCKSCDKKWEYETIAAEALESYGAEYNYRAMKDGGDGEIVACPNCNEEAYIFSEEHCGVCGESAEHTCYRCSGEIPSSEIFLGNGLCGYCHHMLNKDD